MVYHEQGKKRVKLPFVYYPKNEKKERGRGAPRGKAMLRESSLRYEKEKRAGAPNGTRENLKGKHPSSCSRTFFGTGRGKTRKKTHGALQGKKRKRPEVEWGYGR